MNYIGNIYEIGYMGFHVLAKKKNGVLLFLSQTPPKKTNANTLKRRVLRNDCTVTVPV